MMGAEVEMKVPVALAAAIAQTTMGFSDAVFPASGEHVTYSIHDSFPRGGAYDTTLTLAGGSAATIVVSAPGKGSMRVALDNGQPSHMTRSLGMGFHLLEVANAIVQAGLNGSQQVAVEIGPPGTDPAMLKVSSAGGTITASGLIAMPPPPRRGADRQGPPQGAPPEHAGDRKLQVRIVVSVVNGKLSKARGEFSPADARGPHDTWTVNRK
jgi:hypothetical protein